MLRVLKEALGQTQAQASHIHYTGAMRGVASSVIPGWSSLFGSRGELSALAFGACSAETCMIALTP